MCGTKVYTICWQTRRAHRAEVIRCVAYAVEIVAEIYSARERFLRGCVHEMFTSVSNESHADYGNNSIKQNSIESHEWNILTISANYLYSITAPMQLIRIGIYIGTYSLNGDTNRSVIVDDRYDNIYIRDEIQNNQRKTVREESHNISLKYFMIRVVIVI